MKQTLRLLMLCIGMCSVLLNFIAILAIQKQHLDICAYTTPYTTRDVNVIAFHSIVRATSKINCSNIHEINLKQKLGNGWFKETYEGDFHGMPVAVKFPMSHGRAYSLCTGYSVENVSNINETSFDDEDKRWNRDNLCFRYIVMKLMTEVLMLEQIDHPQLARLLGYCIRDPSDRSDTIDLKKRGMIIVTELANETRDKTYSWKQQMKQAAELADLLNYMEHSPLGSMTFADFKTSHFLMSNGTFKLVDMDMAIQEPTCQKDGEPCHNETNTGFNAIFNMIYMKQMFIDLLTSPFIPANMTKKVNQLKQAIRKSTLSASKLHDSLKALLRENI